MNGCFVGMQTNNWAKLITKKLCIPQIFLDFIEKANLNEAKEDLFLIIGLSGLNTKVTITSDPNCFMFDFVKVFILLNRGQQGGGGGGGSSPI